MCALTNIPKEKILDVLKQGPSFPTKIAKALGADSMLVGAILSTLISTSEVRVSTLKIGGSPLYYIPEQESKLEEFISYLNDKDRKTFQLLKEKKVLLDADQDPLIRVSLRTIKDFAKSFEIEFDGKLIVCWRFYNITKDDAKILAEDVVKASLKPLAAQPLPVMSDNAHGHLDSDSDELHETKHAHHTHVTHKVKHDETPEVNDVHEVHKKEAHKEIHETKKIEVVPVEKIAEKTTEHLVEKDVTKKVEDEPKEKDNAIEKSDKVEKNDITPKIDFLLLVKKHITSKNLDIISTQKIKKTEYDFVLKNHDSNEYIYCKAKDKKTIGEGDLAPAMIFAQNKKMPCIFFSTGTLSKKTASMMDKEFNQIKFEKIN